MNELPRGWVKCILGDLASYVTSGSRDWSKFYADEGAMFVRTQDINTNALVNYDQIARVSLPEKVEGKRTLIRRDDILITITGANVGKCAYVRAEIPEAYVSQSVALVRLKEPSLAAYLQRQLISPAEGSSSTSLEQSAYGLGRPVLSLDDVREAPIRLAPLKEQRRIVAKIDSLSGKSKRARDHLDHVPRLVQKYKEAILQTAFSAGLTDAADKNTFAPIVFSEIVASTFYGPRISSDAYVESGIPTLRTTDISDWGRLILRSPPQVQVTESDFAKWGLQDQDLIVTRTGATIGKCAIYEKAIGPALPSAYLIRVRLLLDRIDAKYALLFLLSPDGQRQLLAGRTAVAQPNINAGAICAVKLPLPKLEVQRELVHRIHSAFAWIDRLASEATSARKLINHLDQAILSKAFRGELVPQDPNDEPASVLLKKIRGEKVKEPGKKRGRR